VAPIPKAGLGKRIAGLMKTLSELPPGEATDGRFEEVVAQITSIPAALRPPTLLTTLAAAFHKDMEVVNTLLRVKGGGRRDFDVLLPKSGWIADYLAWTLQTEPPSVFHFFIAALTVGATLGRKVFFDKGSYKVFPNMFVMLLAPSGRCRKTSAANLGTGLYVKAGGTLVADKTTPEAMIDTLVVSPAALIYAQELAVFLGKQKYQEGMVPLLTSLSDSPDLWISKTVSRAEVTIQNIALSALMCSTVDWLQSSVPADVFGGGFMSRFLFVVQEDTPRCFPLPPPLDVEVRKALVAKLVKFRNLKGQTAVTLDAEAYAWHDRWYRTRRDESVDKQFAGYIERKPDHMLRLAMIMKMARADADFILRVDDLLHAYNILNWLEDWFPAAFDQLATSAVGEDQGRILRILRKSGGSMEHSLLLRRNSSRLNAEQFKRATTTLREAGLMEWDGQARTYTLTPEGWGV